MGKFRRFPQTDAVGGFALPQRFSLRMGLDDKPVTGIFDEPYLNAQLGEYEVDDAQPRFTCKSSDVKGVARGDDLLLPDGRKFHVMTYPQQDGTGMSILKLWSECMISLDISAQGIESIIAELEPTEKQVNAALSRTLNKMAKGFKREL